MIRREGAYWREGAYKDYQGYTVNLHVVQYFNEKKKNRHRSFNLRTVTLGALVVVRLESRIIYVSSDQFILYQCLERDRAVIKIGKLFRKVALDGECLLEWRFLWQGGLLFELLQWYLRSYGFSQLFLVKQQLLWKILLCNSWLTTGAF